MNIEDCLCWVRERESVRIHKENGLPQKDWTSDPILMAYRFCNVRREDDRVTRWIDRHIRKPYADHPHLWFMLCIARQINWPDTLAVLLVLQDGCWPDQKNFSPRSMTRVLDKLAQGDRKVWTGAYTITAPPIKGMKKSEWVCEHTLGELWKHRDTFRDLWDGKQPSMKHVHATLMKFDCWGPFMSYQAVVDMRFTSLLSSARDTSSWAAAGPGTIRGLNRVHERSLNFKLSQTSALIEMLELYPVLRRESGVEMDFSDVPNVLCETDKYMRVKYGEGTPRATYVAGRGW